MNSNIKLGVLAPAFMIGMGFVASQAQAASVTLTFDDLVNGAAINSWFTGTQINPFYNFSSPAKGPQYGPSDGVVFSSNAVEEKAGQGTQANPGTGRFENLPNPPGAATPSYPGVLYFPYSPTTSYVNDASGFNKLSLDYSLLNNLLMYEPTVDIYSGLSGTGNLLATLVLSPASTTVACVLTGRTGDEFCTWALATAANFGTAESFTVVNNPGSPTVAATEFAYMNLATTPLPASWIMMLSGLACIGFIAAYRRMSNGSTVEIAS